MPLSDRHIMYMCRAGQLTAGATIRFEGEEYEVWGVSALQFDGTRVISTVGPSTKDIVVHDDEEISVIGAALRMQVPKGSPVTLESVCESGVCPHELSRGVMLRELWSGDGPFSLRGY